MLIRGFGRRSEGKLSGAAPAIMAIAESNMGYSIRGAKLLKTKLLRKEIEANDWVRAQLFEVR